MTNIKLQKIILFSIIFLSSFLVGEARVAQARDWYFDKDSIGGSCSNVGEGTIAQPFCSIFNVLWDRVWNGAQAGDTIYIRQGTYTGRLFWIKEGVLDNGTAENPIAIKAYPGETVIFDGQNWDYLIKLSGTANSVHDLHFIGPFEVKNYSTAFEQDAPNLDVARTNFLFDNWNIHDGSAGFIFRSVDGVTVKNSNFYNLKGFSTSIADNVIGVSIRGRTDYHSTNILIENCTAYDINDGRGNDNGDADGFHTDENCDVATFRNLQAYRCSEDGIDTKAQTVVMENLSAYHNGATGIKMWGWGNKVSTYDASNLLVYGNTETGIKCTGGLSLTATVDNLTAWGNGEEDVKNTQGDTSNGCDLTIRNSIIGETGIRFYAPRTSYASSLNLINTDIFPTLRAIDPAGCASLTGSGKYTANQYLAGTFNIDLSSGYNCGGAYGAITGSSINPFIFNPELIDVQPKFQWSSIAHTAITTSSLLLATESNYPWPAPVVGSYVEIDDDSVRREVIAVGDTSVRTIEFSPAVSPPVCGRKMDCRGVRIIGWNTEESHLNNFSLTAGSPAIGVGVLVSGVHCTLADDNGGSGLIGCIHWNGTNPDLGFMQQPVINPDTTAPNSPTNLSVL